MYKQKSENGDKISVFLKQIMKKFSLFLFTIVHTHDILSMRRPSTWKLNKQEKNVNMYFFN